MTELTSWIEGLFVKNDAWSKFIVQIGKYIKNERNDKIVYHNLIASATKRLTSLEAEGTQTPPNQHRDPFATQQVHQVVPVDVTAFMAHLESLERTIYVLKDYEGKEKSAHFGHLGCSTVHDSAE